MVIWKYPLVLKDEQKIQMPLVAWPLCVQMQNGQPMLWMKVDPTSESVESTIYIVGTGHPVPDGRSYVGTFQVPPFVWHVFA